MRSRHSAVVFIVTVLCFARSSAAAPPGDDVAAEPVVPELTLEAARAAAWTDSPEVRAAEAAVAEARARLTRARVYPHNPRVEAERADRRGPEGATTDRGVALRQELEIAGQRGKRTAAARAGLAAAQARLDRVRRRVGAAVEAAFAEAIRARALLRIAGADLELTRELVRFEERRLEAGAGTQIELNLARAAAGRAARRLHEETAAWEQARSRLADEVGSDPANPPVPAGGLPAATGNPPPLDRLVRRALAERSDLRARTSDLEQARRRVSVERSLAVPNLEVGAFAAREEGDDVTGVRAGIAIPLFDRNQGGIAEARAAESRAGAERADLELRVRREVASAHARYRTAAAAVQALDGLVVGTLRESLSLLRQAVDAGKVSASDVLLLRRELVEGRRERVRAGGDAWIAWNDLELAVGADLPGGPTRPSPPEPDGSGESKEADDVE
ncbi:MAG: TolC family protein [Acidobacteriota bacterium]|jgi:cobalt-zinc-cadmium efflux system outer membrane protein